MITSVSAFEDADQASVAPKLGISRAETEIDKPIRIDAGLIVFLAAVVTVVTLVHRAADNRFDFGAFYYGTRMVWDGARTLLYDFDVQRLFQIRYGRTADLWFISPPIVLVPFLPLVLLPIGAAYVIWTGISVGLLVSAIKSITERLGLFYANWPIVLSLAFLPVASNLAHGQLSIVVLFAYVECYLLWRSGRRFAGGMWLALVLVKFQLLAGFLCVLLLKRKWRELMGFACAGVPLALLSWAIVGTHGLLAYPAFVLNSESRGISTSTLKMANLRGLVRLLLGDNGHVALVIALSLIVLVAAAKGWTALDVGFATALTATMLVSYHFNPQDLSLSLIPLFLIASHSDPSALRLVVLLMLSLPFAVAILGGHYALLGVPLIGGFIGLLRLNHGVPQLAGGAPK